jgi:hypothetical protein
MMWSNHALQRTRREKFWPIIAALSMVVAAATLLLRHRDKAVIETVRQETVGLRAELEARDRSVSELQAKLEESLQQLPTQQPTSSADSLAELARRFDQLTVQQNKTLALVESLAASKAVAPEPPEQAQQRRQSAVALLDWQLKSEQDKLDAAKQKVEQLVTAWRVPDEVSTMDVTMGLDHASLKQYWPYFEAKRERDELQRYVSILKIRVMAEKIDLGLEATKGGSQ